MTLCRRTIVREQTDFSQQLFGARRYLEKIGVLDAQRGPGPRFAPGELRVHTIPLFPPLPPARYVGFLLGEPPPDRGQTPEWPHPEDSV
jgi:hypothetical protein